MLAILAVGWIRRREGHLISSSHQSRRSPRNVGVCSQKHTKTTLPPQGRNGGPFVKLRNGRRCKERVVKHLGELCGICVDGALFAWLMIASGKYWLVRSSLAVGAMATEQRGTKDSRAPGEALASAELLFTIGLAAGLPTVRHLAAVQPGSLCSVPIPLVWSLLCVSAPRISYAFLLRLFLSSVSLHCLCSVCLLCRSTVSLCC